MVNLRRSDLTVMQSSRNIYVVGKKNGAKEQTRIATDTSKNATLLKLRYMAAHRIARKKTTPADTFQFLLTGWTIHSIATALESRGSEPSFTISYLLSIPLLQKMMSRFIHPSKALEADRLWLLPESPQAPGREFELWFQQPLAFLRY